MDIQTYEIHCINAAGEVDCRLPCYRDLQHAEMRAGNILHWDRETVAVEVYRCGDDGRPIAPHLPVFRDRVPF